ncbi:MAG: hypothetical protein AAF725_28090, partial [Acidobacteriota bacterium]
MALEQKLSLKLSQKLVMTPSLQQAIKLLQMNHLELEGVLAEEMAENPVLEESEPIAVEEEATPNQTEETPDQEAESLQDIDMDAFFSDYAESWEERSTASVYEQKEGPPLENTLSQDDDLTDHLLFQLHMMDLPPLVREVAELVIGNLDEDGFLVATVEEICAMGADRPPRQAEEENRAVEAILAAARAAREGADASLAADLEVGDGGDPEAEDPGAGELGSGEGGASAESLASSSPENSASPEAAGSSQAPSLAASAAPSSSAAPLETAIPDGEQPPEAAEEEGSAGSDLPTGSFPRRLVRMAIDVVQGLDPAGVATVDLAE